MFFPTDLAIGPFLDFEFLILDIVADSLELMLKRKTWELESSKYQAKGGDLEKIHSACSPSQTAFCESAQSISSITTN